MFHKGQGCYLYDVENRKYLDFTAGIAVNSLGHCDEQMSRILFEQSQMLVHASNLYYNPWTGALNQLLVESTKEAGCKRCEQGIHLQQRKRGERGGDEVCAQVRTQR